VRWEVTAEGVARLAGTKQWEKLTVDEQVDMAGRLEELAGFSITDRDAMAKKLGSVPKAIAKQLRDALTVKDPEAPLVANRKGEPEPDPDLRENESVSLPPIPVSWEADPSERLASIEYGSMVEDYVDADVRPYIEDAWVDHDKTKIGYEIPIARYFYKYPPPRCLAEIDDEIRKLESEIQTLLSRFAE
jgi:type I restriction enzyme M protein